MMILTIAALLLAVHAPIAGLSEHQNAAVARYLSDLEQAGTHGGVTVEQVFVDALALETLVGSSDEPGLEDLSSDDYDALEKRLRGIVVNREEVVLARPDPAFFLELAISSGRAVDRSFAAAYHETYPSGVWPVYLEQQTDYSGCIAFGENHLVESYRRWTQFFQQTYANHYTTAVQAELESIGESLLGTCACGDRESVVRELRAFITAFPKHRITSDIRKRLKDIERGSRAMRYECISG